MKKIGSTYASFVVFSMLLLIGFTQTGCEEAENTGALTVEPRSVSMTNENESVVLTVVGGITNNMLSFPLEWQVSNPDLGQITASSGATAVYQRSGRNTGSGTITVRDQFGKEGYVSVTQTQESSPTEPDPDPYSIRLVADPASISVNQGTTISIEGDQARPPFSWTYAGRGTLQSRPESRSVTYIASSRTEFATIRVVDANGEGASIGIEVVAADPPPPSDFRLVAEPSTLLPRRDADVRIDGSAQAPFTWSLVSGPDGARIEPEGQTDSRSVRYIGTTIGNAVISVVDATGREERVTIRIDF